MERDGFVETVTTFGLLIARQGIDVIALIEDFVGLEREMVGGSVGFTSIEQLSHAL